jgi:hypothetical protein
MASTVVVVPNLTPVSVTLPSPTRKIVLTVVGGVPGEVYVTADGTFPVPPVAGTVNPTNQKVLAGILGEQGVIEPQLFGDHMQAPTLKFAAAAAATVQIEW